MLSNQKLMDQLEDDPIIPAASMSSNDPLLLWLSNALPDLNITNFTTDWSDGIALCALVNFCQPGLIPNYRSLDPSDKLRNVTMAMRTAEEKLDIPQSLSPEFLVSPFVDEMSVITYLSNFAQPESPGERRTLAMLKEDAPQLDIRNFTNDLASDVLVSFQIVTSLP